MFCRTILAALLLIAAMPAGATGVRLEPASSWQVDNSPELCRLSREYAAGDERVGLRLEQYRPGSKVDGVIITDRVVQAESMSGFRVRLGRTAPFRTPSFPLILPDGRKAMLFSFQLVKPNATSAFTWPSEAALTAIDEIEISAPGMGSLVFQTRTFGRAMIEMRHCADELVRGWGFDPVQQSSLSKQAAPTTEPRKWLRPSDFSGLPPAVGQIDSLLVRLNIAATGTVTGCYVARSYSDPAVAARTCPALLKRALFTPALDAGGVPVASYWVSRVSRI